MLPLPLELLSEKDPETDPLHQGIPSAAIAVEMARHEKPKAMTSVSEPCAARAAHCDARGDAGPAPAVGQTFVRATSSSVLTTAAMTETAMPELVLLRAAASKPEYVAEKALPPPPELGHEDGDEAQLPE
jgi:hypothetical protein